MAENARAENSCLVAIADTLVLANGVTYYPDVMIYRENEDDPRLVKKPCVLVEVLSTKTQDIDRGKKWLNYQTLETLQAYVLLEQDPPRAEVFRRTAEGWLYAKIKDGELLKLPCVNLEVTLSAIYSRLE